MKTTKHETFEEKMNFNLIKNNGFPLNNLS